MFFELKHPRRGTIQVMGGSCWRRVLLAPALGLSLAAAAAGCGSKAPASPPPPPITDADFAVCDGTPAVRYAPGISALSASGAYRATLVAAATDQGGATPVPTAAVGRGSFTVAITLAPGDAGADAGAPAPDDLAVAPPPRTPTIPADPYMPVHLHGGSTVPVISPMGGGVYGVGNLDFFMGGYWDLYLDLTPPGGTADMVTFQLCIPDD
jgi:hypothetical protein